MLYVEKTALWLTIIGGLNWGLIGLFDFNLVAAVFGGGNLISRIVYILVGLSAVWLVYAQLMPDRTDTGRK